MQEKLLGRKSWSWRNHSSKRGWRYRERKQFLLEINQEFAEEKQQKENDKLDREYQEWLLSH